MNVKSHEHCVERDDGLIASIKGLVLEAGEERDHPQRDRYTKHRVSRVDERLEGPGVGEAE